MPGKGSATADQDTKGGWFARLKAGLSGSTSSLGEGISSILRRGNLGQETLDDLEDHLIASDLGVVTAKAVTAKLAANRFNKSISESEVRSALAEHISQILQPLARPLVIDPAHKPHVILVAGVNGTGKTTTIGKLARRFKQQGLSVMLAAGDTFRAAAVEQLQQWGTRNDVPVVAQPTGADSASVVFDALQSARARDIDVLIADTAGRLHTHGGLMEELKKVCRVMSKQMTDAPHETLLVIDAGTGQNALNQAQEFKKAVGVTGIVISKLDGTAKGGTVFSVAENLSLPIRFIGVGEAADDLQEFEVAGFVDSILRG